MTWFVDCGAHRGESLQLARAIYGESLHCIAVEPLAACWPHLEREGAIVIPAALWTEAGTRRLYLGGQEVSSSLLAEKTSGGVSPDRFVDVPTVRLGPILQSLCGYEVVLKLDVEGAEYDVLEQLLDDGAPSLRDLFVDFHADRIAGFPVERHNELVARLLAFGFPLPKWSPIQGGVIECGRAWFLP